MIELVRLQQFRNIAAAEFALADRLNIFVGENGSGKTSLLEAVHVLSRAKSFRSSNLRPLVRHQQSSFTIFAQCAAMSNGVASAGPHRLGMAFDLKQGKSAKLDGEVVRNASSLARQLPVVYFGPETLNLLAGSPDERRSFIDWGLFHVEPRFLGFAQRYGRALKQRNAALRSASSTSEVGAWNGELVEAGEALTQLRHDYLEALWPLFMASLLRMSPRFPLYELLDRRFVRGWTESVAFEAQLTTGFAADQAAGFTRYGPHRADMVLTAAGRLLRDEVSAGQGKVVVCALLYAQAQLIETRTGTCPVMLIDDLPAELDETHRATVLAALSELDTQFLVSATERGLLDLALLGQHDAVFHVEHGSFLPLDGDRLVPRETRAGATG